MVKQNSVASDKSKKSKPTPEAPAPPEAEAAPSPPEHTAQDKLAALRAERDELKDRVLRLTAETDNFKKRLERDKADFLRRANEGIAKDLLPILDNLERALQYAENHGSQGSLVEGVALTSQQLMKVLERHGLEKIEALAQPFNPEFHEAMMQQEDQTQNDNTVLMELQKGYLFQGRLLRPAMVVVSKKPAPNYDEGTEI